MRVVDRRQTHVKAFVIKDKEEETDCLPYQPNSHVKVVIVNKRTYNDANVIIINEAMAKVLNETSFNFMTKFQLL